ncbi:MAG: outer membrane beta-barrel protein [Bacteroidia bacterium]
MKKILAVTFFFLLALISIAQDRKTFVSVHGGVNFSNITVGGTSFTDWKNRTGICAGLGFGYKAAKKILLLVEANYDQKGYRNEYTITDEKGMDMGKAYANNYSDYLSVPIIINYTSKGENTFEAGIGIINNFLLSADIMTPPNQGGFPPNSEINYKELYKGYELDFTIRVGGSIKIASQLNLLLEGRISNGLTSFSKSDEVKSIHNTMFLGTGVRYYFNEKKEEEIK